MFAGRFLRAEAQKVFWLEGKDERGVSVSLHFCLLSFTFAFVFMMAQGAERRVARKFLISGEVQGVGYRFFAQRVAARHQVAGYVKNLPDGRVEALAEGTPEAVEAFKHDLATGPEYSYVAQIEEVNLEPTGSYPAFRIER